MDKVGVCVFVLVVILSVSVFASATDIRQDIVDFMRDKNVSVEDEDIEEIDFANLPGELDIQKINGTNVGIYQVAYENRSLFVVGHSGEEKSVVSSPSCESISYLSFGSSKKMNEAGFLDMASGVEGSLEKGYVMMRAGSVTGISTSLEVEKAVEMGRVEIVIYKNGEEIGFRNSLDAESSGVVIDYDSQSKGIVSYEAGDVVSVYLNSDSGVRVVDVTTMVEMTE